MQVWHANSMLMCTNRRKEKCIRRMLSQSSPEIPQKQMHRLPFFCSHLMHLIAKLTSCCGSSTWSSVNKWDWRPLQSNQTRKRRAQPKNNMRWCFWHKSLNVLFLPQSENVITERHACHIWPYFLVSSNYGLKWLTICSNIQMSYKSEILYFPFLCNLKRKTLVYREIWALNSIELSSTTKLVFKLSE
jgi:hypothetical protein